MCDDLNEDLLNEELDYLDDVEYDLDQEKEDELLEDDYISTDIPEPQPSIKEPKELEDISKGLVVETNVVDVDFPGEIEPDTTTERCDRFVTERPKKDENLVTECSQHSVKKRKPFQRKPIRSTRKTILINPRYHGAIRTPAQVTRPHWNTPPNVETWQNRNTDNGMNPPPLMQFPINTPNQTLHNTFSNQNCMPQHVYPANVPNMFVEQNMDHMFGYQTNASMGTDNMMPQMHPDPCFSTPPPSIDMHFSSSLNYSQPPSMANSNNVPLQMYMHQPPPMHPHFMPMIPDQLPPHSHSDPSHMPYTPPQNMYYNSNQNNVRDLNIIPKTVSNVIRSNRHTTNNGNRFHHSRQTPPTAKPSFSISPNNRSNIHHHNNMRLRKLGPRNSFNHRHTSDNQHSRVVKSNLVEVKPVDDAFVVKHAATKKEEAPQGAAKAMQPISIEPEDEETRQYRLKMEEQKKERERIWKLKEERRRLLLQAKHMDSNAMTESPPPLIPKVIKAETTALPNQKRDGPTSTLDDKTKLLNTRMVYIKNLSTGTSRQKLFEMTKNIGVIESLKLENEERRATILFKTVASAQMFFKKYQRYMLDLSMIQVVLQPMT